MSNDYQLHILLLILPVIMEYDSLEELNQPKFSRGHKQFKHLSNSLCCFQQQFLNDLYNTMLICHPKKWNYT